MDSEAKMARLEEAITIRPTRPKNTRISSKYNDSQYIKKIEKDEALSSDDIGDFKVDKVRRYTDDEIIDIKKSGKKGCHSIISDGLHFKIPIDCLGLDELEKNNNGFEEYLDEYELGEYSACTDWDASSRVSRKGKTLESLLENDNTAMGAAKDFIDFLGNFIFKALEKIPTSEGAALDHIIFNRERLKI